MARVELVPMNEAEFRAFLAVAVPSYAQDKVDAGNWQQAQALEFAAQAFKELLPNGLATPDNFLFSIVAETGSTSAAKTPVGVLWFAVGDSGPNRTAFLYNLEVYEPFRRRGYGTGALQALEEKAVQLGLTSIGLHVFGFNRDAQAMYEKMGYVVTNINMAKSLS